MAFATVTASVAFGLVLSTRLFGRSVAPAWLMEMHRHLGAVSIAATLLHMGSLIADNYTSFSLKDVLVPFSSVWKPGPVAWGILAFWLLIVIEVSSLLMHRLPKRVWHSIHLTSFVVFAGALVHGIQAGADAGTRLAQTIAISTAMTVLFLGLVRYLAPRRAKRKLRQSSTSKSKSDPVPTATAKTDEALVGSP